MIHLHQRVVYIDLNMVRAAVGSLAFVENVESELGSKAMQRDIEHIDGAYTLLERFTTAI
jgi:hypothetical protein